MNKYEALGRYTKLKEIAEYLLEEINNYAKQCGKPECHLVENPIMDSAISAQNIHCSGSRLGKSALQSDV